MKLRNLTLRSGKAAAWPPRWVEFFGPSETVAEEGVLEGIQRLGNRLLLQINVNGRRRTASLEWDPPPRVGAVEAVLLASIGLEVRNLGDRELPARTSGGDNVNPATGLDKRGGSSGSRMTAW
jgi:hypothetical protein